MKGHMQDGKFHPHTDYKKVSRKKREPFSVTKNRVKVSQRELIQMQRADVGRRRRTLTMPKLQRVKEQEDGLVKFWAESSDGNTVASLIQSKDFPDEMEIRVTTLDDRFTVRGHKSIMDQMSFNEFLDKVMMHIERGSMTRKKRDNHSKAKPYAGDKLTGSMVHDLILLQKHNGHDGSVEDVENLDKQQMEKLWKIMTSDEAFGVDHRSEKEMKDFYDNLSEDWKNQYGFKEHDYNEKTGKFDTPPKPNHWNDLKKGDKGMLKLIVWRFNEPASSDNWFEMWKEPKNGKWVKNRDPIEAV